MAVDEILVVGAGITGLETASELARSGHKVCVVDAGKIASATSFAHTAMLSQYSAYTLDPKKLHRSVYSGGFAHGLARRETLPADSWVEKTFSREERAANLEVRSKLAKYSINSWLSSREETLRKAGFYFGRGLRVYDTPGLAEQDFRKLKKLGINAQVETPGLLGANAISFPAGCINIYDYCTILAKELVAQGNVRILENTKMERLCISHNLVRGAVIKGEPEEFKSVVICSGADKALLESVNHKVADAIAPFTGVSVNTVISKTLAGKLPKVFQVSYNENGHHHIVSASNIMNRGQHELRVAGFFMAGILPAGDRYFGFAVQQITGIVESIVPQPKKQTIWHGVRPMTNDGLPIIGEDGNIRRLFYNIGHGSSAVPLCNGSAQIIAEHLNPERTTPLRRMFDIDLRSLSPNRCGRQRQ